MIMNLQIIHKFGRLLAAVERVGGGCVSSSFVCIVVVQSKSTPYPAFKTCRGNNFFYLLIRYELRL
jgi:hypothetical protein